MHVSVRVIRDMKNGSEAAFDKVYDAYHKYIYYIIHTYVKNTETTKDLTQEAFIKMYKNLNQLEDLNAFHQWFIMLSKHLALDLLRDAKQNAFITDGEQVLGKIKDHSYSPSPGIFEFKSLNDDELKIINYKIIYEVTFNDIALEMGLSLSVVTKMYYKAIKKLKKEMEVL